MWCLHQSDVLLNEPIHGFGNLLNELSDDFSFKVEKLAVSKKIHEISEETGKKKSNTKKHGREID
jgi:hypothetical protein